MTATSAAATAMVTKILPFVRKISYDVCKHNRHVTIDDVYGGGVVGAMEAAKRYDPNRGASFITYSANWIREYARRELWACLNPVSCRTPAGNRLVVRGALPDDHATSFSVPADDETGGATLVDSLKEHFGRLIGTGRVTLREAEWFIRYTTTGETLAQIGDSYGVSRERVRQSNVKIAPYYEQWLAAQRRELT